MSAPDDGERPHRRRSVVLTSYEGQAHSSGGRAPDPGPAPTTPRGVHRRPW
ncbi:MAG: hypothetical protein AVDCRST_MAG06-306 [uncultured Nocardioides sp.]|uniref:Uncharacterized protein n=1 Tax=uncultured Nocardioides sp. TaxID=198441 RepID=A0A6J4N5R3_9ACTN|nr:MAG: hypothetical protein AVDCRST_MAG06-306 [uncultured Nocardioides sp.]